jgi:hypothetical protein
VTAGLTHTVDAAVDNAARRVDDTGRTSVVHRGVTVAHRKTSLSSTTPRLAETNVPGSFATLSPASTDAKTTDELLNFMNDNGQSDCHVDSGDIHRHEAPHAHHGSTDDMREMQ